MSDPDQSGNPRWSKPRRLNPNGTACSSHSPLKCSMYSDSALRKTSDLSMVKSSI